MEVGFGEWLLEQAYPVAVSTIAALAISMLTRLEFLFPDARKMYDGFQKYKYTASIFVQCVVLPGCLVHMLWDYPSLPTTLHEVTQFLGLGRQAFAGRHCWFFYALMASQTKDFVLNAQQVLASTKMTAHHLVVMLFSFWADRLEFGYVNFMLCSFALELGSTCFNLFTIYPQSKPCWYMYHVGILLSHVVAMYGMLHARTYDLPFMVLPMFYVCGIAVIIGRQLHSLKALKAGFEAHARRNGGSALAHPAAATFKQRGRAGSSKKD
eukprot:TRINITY_DN2231_c0_g1_i2.p1 TRINITY_DN2231_c0_g1~~TRINITY_DN2231_c0_g1_i2.p1  ORF type:complete len:267 (-),score=35.22 TRINITY_DN2231_c0_g1_i2:168-968(-)